MRSVLQCYCYVSSLNSPLSSIHVKYIELNTFYEIIGEHETALTYTIS